jgi:hypothetical protein
VRRIDNFCNRLARLEASQPCKETPHLILSSCPMPDELPGVAMIEQWLDEGLAHVAFKGRAIFYDGGEGQLAEDQWQLRYCTDS